MANYMQTPNVITKRDLIKHSRQRSRYAESSRKSNGCRESSVQSVKIDSLPEESPHSTKSQGRKVIYMRGNQAKKQPAELKSQTLSNFNY